MHWLHCRTAKTSSAHSWGQQLLCGSRNYQSPIPQSPSTATHLTGDLNQSCHFHYGSKRLSSWLQASQFVHDLSHPGTKAMAKLVGERSVWPRMQDCYTWARAC
jgi:hypothetical protein